MKNDFRGKNQRGEPLAISILPTLMITAMGQTNIQHTVGSSFQKSGDLIYLLNPGTMGLKASELAQNYSSSHQHWATLPTLDPEKNIQFYNLYHQALSKKLIISGHDIAEGGVLVAIAEAMIGEGMGAEISLSHLKDNHTQLAFLFNESPGQFIVSLSPLHRQEFERHFQNRGFVFLGRVTDRPSLDLANIPGSPLALSIPLDQVIKHWKKEWR